MNDHTMDHTTRLYHNQLPESPHRHVREPWYDTLSVVSSAPVQARSRPCPRPMQLSVRASYRSHRFAVPPPGTPTRQRAHESPVLIRNAEQDRDPTHPSAALRPTPRDGRGGIGMRP